MHRPLLLSSCLFLLHVTVTPHLSGHYGRRVCGGQDIRPSVVMVTESYVQSVHKPYITLCQGHRLCSTYKTVYRVAYRKASRVLPFSPSFPECCPGWRRFHSLHCNQALCSHTCVNGGTCLRPNQCGCTLGWMGTHCQRASGYRTHNHKHVCPVKHYIDECEEQHPCSQQCVNTAGSYRCVCREGFRLAGDGHSCQRLPAPAAPLPTPTSSTRNRQVKEDCHRCSADAGGETGLAQNVTEEVQSLRNRVRVLEQKLQLVLAPFNSLFPPSLDDGFSEKTTVLSHSLRQLDRIDSLSEQIGFLEERIGTCSCQGVTEH